MDYPNGIKTGTKGISLAELISQEMALRSITLKQLSQSVRRAATQDGGYSRASEQLICKWRSGQVTPGRMHVRWLALALEMPIEMIAAAAEVQRVSPMPFLPTIDLEEMNRREFGLSVAGMGAMAPLDFAKILSSKSGDARIEELRQITNQFASWYWRISPGSLLPLIGDHQSRLMMLLRAAPAKAQGSLKIISSETAVLAGLAAYKHGDPETARRQFEIGTELARQVNDGPAIAHAYRAQRNVISSGAVRGGNRSDSARALSMLDTAVEVARAGAPPLQLAMLFTTRAEERAVMGLKTEALQDIDRAAKALAQAGKPKIGYYDHWNEARLQGWYASVLLYLNRPAEAVKVLEQIVPATPNELVSDKADVLGDLGAAYAQAGQPEQAVNCLTASLNIARQGGIDDGVARIQHIRDRHLSSYSDLQTVSALNEQLTLQ